MDPNDIKILIDSLAFNNKHVFSLDHTNEKWFMNLLNSVISREVFTLLQLGERFSLPIDHDKNKKLAIHEFIKDIESDLVLKKFKKQTFVRNMAIPQLYKFLKRTPSVNPLVSRLSHLHKVTEQFCHNNEKHNFHQSG